MIEPNKSERYYYDLLRLLENMERPSSSMLPVVIAELMFYSCQASVCSCLSMGDLLIKLNLWYLLVPVLSNLWYIIFLIPTTFHPLVLIPFSCLSLFSMPSQGNQLLEGKNNEKKKEKIYED